MILSRVSEYLRTHRQASLQDMSIGLNADAQALRGMLDVLQNKGRVRKLPSGTACASGCVKCKPDTVELYAWVNPTDKQKA